MRDTEGDLLIKRAIEIIERDPPHWRKSVRANVLQHWACAMFGLFLGWLVLGRLQPTLSMAIGATGALLLVRFDPPPITTFYRRRRA